MNFSITQRDKVAILKSQVEKLDALQAPVLKAQLILLGKSGSKNIILDLSESRYCDSSGLSAILVGKRLCTDLNGSFVICGLQPSVTKLISIAQLDKVLNIVPTVDEAVDMVYMEEQERELGA
jgi:anti-sigma B factor antagonist